MEKSKNSKWDTRTIVFLGLLIAIQIVLSRVFGIELGSRRISLGPLSTILAGLWFGPVGGGVCGLVADLLGCLLRGYAPNPLITIGAMMWGIIPALFRPMLTGTRRKKIVFLCVGVFLASVLATLGFTTAGNALYYGSPLAAMFLTRLPQWAIAMPIYCVLTCVLYLCPLTGVVMNLSGQGASKRMADL